jgi:hypothetical protein
MGRKYLRRPLTAIPEPPSGTEPGLRAFLNAVKESLEVSFGRRGDPMSEVVTKGELVDSGVATLLEPGGSALAPAVITPSEARILPPVPVGFTAGGFLGGVHLSWENPYNAYSVHAYTEVWRAPANDPAQRVLIGSSRSSSYFDRIPEAGAVTYWYWIRFVSEYDRYGPFSLVFEVEKPADVGAIMDEISGQINQSDLSTAFNNEVAQIKASYVVKLDPTGTYAAGFGLYNSGTTSEFAIQVDRFSIGVPGSAARKPFIVDGGVVYIDTALIRNASIQEGQLGPIGIGKITLADGTPVTTVAGLIRADAIDVGSLTVDWAKVTGAIQSTANGTNGQPRWVLSKNGGMQLNSVGAGGRMEVRDNVIKVFDAGGVLRVQFGDLTA